LGGGGIEVNRRREKARKYERKKNRRVIKGNGKKKYTQTGENTIKICSSRAKMGVPLR
jgi:hypothetical protein